jgi:sulfate adenylyltransferase subunit 1 (EFTu-like GTPase family)
MKPLKFITCGSVDDGKSTLIGRLLVDSKAVLQDHLAGVTHAGQTDLALLTDGLSAEREQGITIDVAYRYFNTETRKFIIGDAPGHEQYTRNMVTAASQADAAVVLVDATKLAWRDPQLALLPQTRRHSLLCQLLRVESIVFAVNKLDAVEDAALAFRHIAQALETFAAEAGIRAHIEKARAEGRIVKELRAPDGGHFIAPTVIRVNGIADLGREIFGPGGKDLIEDRGLGARFDEQSAQRLAEPIGVVSLVQS